MTIDSADDSKISNPTINMNRISNRTYEASQVPNDDVYKTPIGKCTTAKPCYIYNVYGIYTGKYFNIQRLSRNN